MQIYRSIGLTSDVHVGDAEANNAQAAATTFITGNYSWDHGGGIMSNGDLYLGVPADTYVYPSLKLKASKALKNKQTEKEEMLTKISFLSRFIARIRILRRRLLGKMTLSAMVTAP